MNVGCIPSACIPNIIEHLSGMFERQLFSTKVRDILLYTGGLIERYVERSCRLFVYKRLVLVQCVHTSLYSTELLLSVSNCAVCILLTWTILVKQYDIVRIFWHLFFVRYNSYQVKWNCQTEIQILYHWYVFQNTRSLIPIQETNPLLPITYWLVDTIVFQYLYETIFSYHK